MKTVKIETLRIRNFGPIEKADLKVSDAGLVLITGQNKDTDAASSNGSGKSHVLGAIVYGLYGKLPDGRKYDELISRPFGDGAIAQHMSVEVVVRILSDEEHLLRIVRARDRKKGPSLRVFLDEVEINSQSIDEAQAHIDQVVGLSYDLFRSSAIMAQKDKDPDLWTGDEQARKSLFKDVLELDRYDRARELASKMLGVKRAEVERLEQEATSYEDQARLFEAQVGETRASFEYWDKKHADQVEVSDAEIERLEQDVKASTVDDATIEKLNTLLAGFKAHRDPFDEALDDAREALSEASDRCSKAAGRVATEERQVERFASGVSDPAKANAELKSARSAYNAAVTLMEKEVGAAIPRHPTDAEIEKEIQHLVKLYVEAGDKLETDAATAAEEVQAKIQELANKGDRLVEKRKAVRKSLDALAGGKCPVCTSSLDKGAPAEHKASLEAGLKQVEEDLAAIEKRVASVDQDSVAEAVRDARKEAKRRRTATGALWSAILSAKSTLEAKATAAENAEGGQERLKQEQESLSKAKEDLRKASAAEAEAKTKLGIAKGRLDHEVEWAEERIQKVRERLAAVKAAKETLGKAQAALDRARASREALDEETNPYAGKVSGAEDRLVALRDRAKAQADKVKGVLPVVEALEFWVGGFANSGLPSVLIDGVMPLLNDRLASHLEVLTSGSIRCQFDTQVETKSGKQVDRIGTPLMIEGVVDDAPSGGQEKKLAIAVRLGFGDVVAQRKGVKVDLLALDEVLDGLDATGRERVLELLRSLRSRYGTVLAVTHDEGVARLFEQQCVVTKHEGRSTLSLPASMEAADG